MDFADKVAAFIAFQQANGITYKTFDEAALALQTALKSGQQKLAQIQGARK